nr:MAG TPA: hypothetical protein [Caudoviricetes sp.]
MTIINVVLRVEISGSYGRVSPQSICANRNSLALDGSVSSGNLVNCECSAGSEHINLYWLALCDILKNLLIIREVSSRASLAGRDSLLVNNIDIISGLSLRETDCLLLVISYNAHTYYEVCLSFIVGSGYGITLKYISYHCISFLSFYLVKYCFHELSVL